MYSVSVIKILFLFFPGIVSTKIMEFLSDGNKKLPINEFIINSFIFGIISYSATYFFKFENNFIGSLYTKTPGVNTLEILVATILSTSLSILILWLKESGRLHQLARKTSLINELSHHSILKTIYNSSESEFKGLRKSFVNISFLNSDKFLFGYLHSHGVTDQGEIELLLQEVQIFQDRKEETVPNEQSALYLRVNPSDIYIEYYSGLDPK